jgi:undecaprenyl pyrophosphate synthase
MTSRYHIFIGTTLDDLKNERRELFRVVMELGHIPVGEDYFDPLDRNSASLIKKNIEECDYFICLAAHRYTGGADGHSALEDEYTWAVKKEIPVIALIIDEKARWKASKKEKDPAIVKKLEGFKVKLRKEPHETWSGTADLRQKFMGLLIQEMNIHPRQGWVKARETVDPLVVNELSRLSSENEELKKRIRMESGELVTRLGEQVRHTLKILALNKVTLSFYYTSGENWENARKFRYLRIFRLLVPELSLGKTTAEISRFLGNVLNPDLEKTVRKDYPTPSNTIRKIMADFSLLKLVKNLEAGGKGGGSGDDEVWEITGYGKELYTAYRLRQLERPFTKKG